MGMCAVLALWVCWDCVWGLLRSGRSTIGGRTAFPVFRACGGLLVLQWCWGCSVFIWTRYRYVYWTVRLIRLCLFGFSVIRLRCSVLLHVVSTISIYSISTPDLSMAPWDSSMMQWTTLFFSFGVCSYTTRYMVELQLSPARIDHLIVSCFLPGWWTRHPRCYALRCLSFYLGPLHGLPTDISASHTRSHVEVNMVGCHGSIDVTIILSWICWGYLHFHG